MFVESLFEPPEDNYLDRGKLLENLLTISHNGMPVIQERTEYPCPLCHCNFGNLQDLVLHECPAEGPIKESLSCCFCYYSTHSHSEFRTHLKLHTSTVLRCGHCNAIFGREGEIALHLQKHDPNGDLKHLIPHQTFMLQSSQVSLSSKNGAIPISPTVIIPSLEASYARYLCTLCSASFDSLGFLAKHGMHHKEYPNVKFHENCLIRGYPPALPHSGVVTCSQCNHSMTHPVEVMAHQCMQANSQLYQCPFCQYTTYVMGSLERHKKLHFKHQCTRCNAHFLNLSALRAHFCLGRAPPTVLITPCKESEVKVQVPTQMGVTCKTCDEKLPSTTAALNHNCKIFCCPVCPFETNKRDGVAMHVEYAHTHKCDGCGCTFISRERLQIHKMYNCKRKKRRGMGADEEDIPLSHLKKQQQRHKAQQRLRQARAVAKRVKEALDTPTSSDASTVATPEEPKKRRGRPPGRRKTPPSEPTRASTRPRRSRKLSVQVLSDSD
uniref:Putative zinc finger protein n=1 Tax=Ornithodoros turicata TaxID=34597 RepID=A0A2R5LJM6_9ACAR